MDQDTVFEIVREQLNAALLSDALDHLGVRGQVMHESIRPLDPELKLVGRAFTVLYVDVHEPPDDPYEKEIEAIDKVRPGDVVVVSTNNSRWTGVWGDLLSTATRARGGQGAVTDGLVRDTRKVLAMKFPVFAAGIKPLDSSGRSVAYAYQCRVRVGDVVVNPGDTIVGDADGLVVLPADLAYEAVCIALERVRKENFTRQELMEGRYLRDVYAKYGVL
ncbi:MAG: RraA family protein [Acidobacteriota bacterium]